MEPLRVEKGVLVLIVSYSFYTDTFYGDTGAIDDEKTWLRYESKAADRLNYLTYGRINTLTEYPDNVKKAVCCIAESLYIIDSIRSDIIKNNGKIATGMSSLGVSVSYSGEETELRKAASDTGAENAYLRKKASEYLQGSGLLYAGF